MPSALNFNYLQITKMWINFSSQLIDPKTFVLPPGHATSTRLHSPIATSNFQALFSPCCGRAEKEEQYWCESWMTFVSLRTGIEKSSVVLNHVLEVRSIIVLHCPFLL